MRNTKRITRNRMERRSHRVVIPYLGLCEKRQANDALSKRDYAALRKAGKRFEEITGLGLIFGFERIEVNASYDLIRLWKAIRNLPEFGHAGSGIHRLFAR